MRIAFDSTERLAFARIETVEQRRDPAPPRKIPIQVGYFDTFEDVHAVIDHRFENVTWWTNGDRMFLDADGLITLSGAR